MEQMNKEALVQEIGKLEQEIETAKAELEEVQAKLGGPTETGKPPVDEEAPENEAEGENGGSETEQLQAREQELISEITTKQMKLVALKKQLENIKGDDAVAEMSKEE
nr:MAG TPA: hypothetical protein [Caudoviricetes sp.]